MNNNDLIFNSGILIELVSFKMPFGKYKGTAIYRLPEPEPADNNSCQYVSKRIP